MKSITFLGVYDLKFDKESGLYLPLKFRERFSDSLCVIPQADGLNPHLCIYQSRHAMKSDVGEAGSRFLAIEGSKITVPLEMRAMSGLSERDCVMFGARNRIELWGVPHYERMMENAPTVRPKIDQILRGYQGHLTE